jgi:hypothetical protein
MIVRGRRRELQRQFNSPVIFQILTNKIANMYFRSLATANSSDYFKQPCQPIAMRKNFKWTNSIKITLFTSKLRPARDWEILNFVKLSQHNKMY